MNVDDFDAAVDLAQELLIQYPRPKFYEMIILIRNTLDLTLPDARHVVHVAIGNLEDR